MSERHNTAVGDVTSSVSLPPTLLAAGPGRGAARRLITGGLATLSASQPSLIDTRLFMALLRWCRDLTRAGAALTPPSSVSQKLYLCDKETSPTRALLLTTALTPPPALLDCTSLMMAKLLLLARCKSTVNCALYWSIV